MRGLSGKKNIFSKYFFGEKEDLLNYEFSFDGGDVMSLPVMTAVDFTIGFDLYMPAAGLYSGGYILYVTGPVSHPYLVFQMDGADPIIYIAAFGDTVGSITMQPDWTTMLDAYHSIDLIKVGSVFTLQIDGVQVDQKTLAGTFTLSSANVASFIGAQDDGATNAAPNGTKIKNMRGIFAPYRMYQDDAGTTLCTAGTKIAKVSSYYSGGFWTQTDNLKRPTMVGATLI